MLKKILFTLALLIAPVLIFASDGAIDKDNANYQAIKALIDAKAITIPLEKDQITRQDVVSYINNAVINIFTDTSGNIATDENIDKVFNMIKAFQTDMMEAGQKLSAIEQTLIDLKIKEEQNKEKQLSDKQDKLLSSTGLRINGDAGSYMTDLLLYGHNSNYITSNQPERFMPLTSFIDLDFNLKALKGMSVDAIFRMENVFGGFWGTQDLFGVRRVSIDGNYQIKFTIGDFQAKMTPYTIWAVDDDRPDESKIFSDKRDMNKEDLFLTDNSWPLTGGTASTTINMFGPDVNIDVMMARLESALRYGYYIMTGNIENPAQTTIVSYAHDQYMGAGSISSELLKDILKLGVNFVEIKDLPDTGAAVGNPVLDNYVGSVNGEVSIAGIAKIKGEFAASDYYSGSNYGQSWQNRYISDTAFRIAAETQYSNTKLEAAFFVNGNSFTAYAAQTRMYDDSNNFPYLTQNNTWNSTSPSAFPLYSVGGIVYPFTRYNPTIVASYFPIGSNLMPYTFYENNAMPYGDATPNRQGLIMKLSGNYIDGMLIPYFKYSYLEEIVSYLPGNSEYFARTFEVTEAGLKLNILNFALKGGYKQEYTFNDAPTGTDVNLNSGILDLGIDYSPEKKWVISVGYKDIAFSGSEFPYTYIASTNNWGYMARQEYNQNIASYGAGIDYQLLSNAALGMSYTNTIIKDNNNDANSFNAQEIDAKLTIKF